MSSDLPLLVTLLVSSNIPYGISCISYAQNRKNAKPNKVFGIKQKPIGLNRIAKIG